VQSYGLVIVAIINMNSSSKDNSVVGVTVGSALKSFRTKIPRKVSWSGDIIKRGIVAKDDEDEKRRSERLKEVSSSSLDLCEL
jgi:hypothetical protein